MNYQFPICYETFGHANNPSIVLITGINGQLIHWPPIFIQQLVQHGFHVVIFDNRDVGLSRYYDHLATPDLDEVISAKQEGKNFQPPYTLEDMAHDVIVLMDKLAIKQAHLAGISMGGVIAQLATLEYPERFLSLTCIATTSSDLHLPPAKPEVLEFFLSPKRQQEDLETFVTTKLQLHKIYNHPDHFNEDRAREVLTRTYHRAYHPAGFKRQLLAMIDAKPRGEKLTQLHIPTLIVHGNYDPVFPLEHGKYLAQCIPNSHLEVIEKMGHGLPESLCGEIVAVIVNHIK